MSDHIVESVPDRNREALSSFTYPWAAAPDIIRAHQKDAYFQSHLLIQLSSIIRSLYGARTAHNWDNEARTFTELLYLGLTTLVGNRTLGEEYTDIVQVEDDTNKLPSITRRAGYILSSVLLPYTLSRFLPTLRRRLRAKLEANLRRSHSKRASDPAEGQKPLSKSAYAQEYILTHLDTLTSPALLYALSLATFYFTGAYYQLSKRLVGLRYVFTRKVEPSDQRVGYEVLGVLLVLQMAVQAYTHVHTTYKSLQQQAAAHQPTSFASGDSNIAALDAAPASFTSPLLFSSSTTNTDPAAKLEHLSKLTSTPLPPSKEEHHYDLSNPEQMQWIEGKQARKCTLCLEALKDPSVTTCGHVFCWQCVSDWLREQPMCPLCRQSARVQHVLPLRC